VANRRAIATGNWSNPAIWDGGVSIPDPADTVYSNTFTVTIDQDVTVVLISNQASAPAVAGGGFILNASRTLTANATGATILTFAANSPSTANFIGNPLCINNGWAIHHHGTGTLNFTGNILQAGGDARGYYFTAAGTCNHVGNNTVSGGGSIGFGGTNVLWTVNSTGTMNCNGNGGNTLNVSLGTLGTLTHVGNIYNTSTSNGAYSVYAGKQVTITGNIYGSDNAASYAVYNSQTSGVYTINGALNAGAQGWAFVSLALTAYNFITGPVISHSLGMFPFLANRLFMIPTPTTYFQFRDNSTAGSLITPAPTYTLYPAAAAIDAPAEADVRDGVVYAYTTQTGTLIVPPTNTVSAGVPVDNTVGSAWLDPQQFADLNAAQIAGLLNGL
jgi:hypothetical protein